MGEFRRFMPKRVELISAATPVAAVDATLDVAVELAENGDIEEAARRLLRHQPDCFAYYCTSMSFARGPGGDIDIAQRITKATGKPATTTSTAILRTEQHEFRSRTGWGYRHRTTYYKGDGKISRVALASPYLSDVEQQFIDFIEAHSIKVTNSLSLYLKDGHAIVPPEKMRQLVESADVPEAEAVFVGCTGQKLGEHLEAMEAKLNKPVLTANQVTSWDALRLMGVSPCLIGRGRLFSQSLPQRS